VILWIRLGRVGNSIILSFWQNLRYALSDLACICAIHRSGSAIMLDRLALHIQLSCLAQIMFKNSAKANYRTQPEGIENYLVIHNVINQRDLVIYYTSGRDKIL